MSAISTFDYFLLTLPIMLWCFFRGVGKNFAKEFCTVFQSVVDTRTYSSGRVDLKQEEENTLLRIIKERAKKSLREIQRCAVGFTPKKGMWWYLGGSATILCTVRPSDGGESTEVLLTVRYKQQMSVRPIRIVEIAEETPGSPK